MKKISPTKDDARSRMIQTAFDLFHQQGVNATSVDEILEKSQTGKSQFYHYFKNKSGLVHAVVQYFFGLIKTQQLPMKYEINSWSDLNEWFMGFVKYQQGTDCTRGCPMSCIAYELTSDDELIRQDINLVCEYTKKPLVSFFQVMKTRGEIRPSADPEALADFCYSIMQGGLILSKIQKDTLGLERAVVQAQSFLKTLRK